MSAEVRNNAELNRYEVLDDGALAGFAEYTISPGRIAFTHTETDPAFAGRGLGKVLATGALDDVRATGGLDVLPHCAFIRGFIAKNPDYLDLVPADRRAEFELG